MNKNQWNELLHFFEAHHGLPTTNWILSSKALSAFLDTFELPLSFYNVTA